MEQEAFIGVLFYIRRNYDCELGFSAFHRKAIFEGKYVVECEILGMLKIPFSRRRASTRYNGYLTFLPSENE